MAEKHERGSNQVNEIGDCLVGVDGTLCSELKLSLSIAEELPKNTTMCFLYDMCREENMTRVRGDMSNNRDIILLLFYILETSRSRENREGPHKNRHLRPEEGLF